MISMVEQWQCVCGYHNMVLRLKCRECGEVNPSGPVLGKVGEALPAAKSDPAEEAFRPWFQADCVGLSEADPETIAAAAFLAGALHEREQCAFVAETHSGFWDMGTIEEIAEAIRKRSMDRKFLPDAVHVTRRRYEVLLAAEQSQNVRSYQARVRSWLLDCFGPEVTYDVRERSHRFLEEAIELAQSIGCTRSEAHQLVDYVFDRPAGDEKQEIGGVMVTLAALCCAVSADMRVTGEAELARVSTPEVMARVRAKNAAKLRSSPLPGQIAPTFSEGGAA